MKTLKAIGLAALLLPGCATMNTNELELNPVAKEYREVAYGYTGPRGLKNKLEYLGSIVSGQLKVKRTQNGYSNQAPINPLLVLPFNMMNVAFRADTNGNHDIDATELKTLERQVLNQYAR